MDAAPAADAGTVAEAAEHLRATERERLRALVQADLPVADWLHADDFQLITPVGVTFSKEQYLGAIASGDIDYRVWEPDSPIEVRLYDRGAVLRYQSRLEMFRRGRHVELAPYWHTDTYEQREGHWQVVWSQATAIQ
jgi:hypothetical protein